MLILTRRIQESIVIGEDITITVVSISQNGKIRLGIEAPRHIPVHRSEVKNDIERHGRSIYDQSRRTGEKCPRCGMGMFSSDSNPLAGSWCERVVFVDGQVSDHGPCKYVTHDSNLTRQHRDAHSDGQSSNGQDAGPKTE